MTNLNAEIAAVAVTVGGQRISLRTDKDPEYLEKLANEVNSHVDALKSATRNTSMLQIFAYVSLQLADALNETKNALKDIIQESAIRTENILNLVEKEEREKDIHTNPLTLDDQDA